MSKEKAIPVNTFLHGLFQFGVYKRTQGKITRQVTCSVIWITFALAAWSLYRTLTISALPNVEYYFPGALLLIGLWVGFRVVNMPRFADFLIAVEAEMNKVSWPTRGELIRASLVVILVIFILAILLFSFDLIWKFLFEWIGVLKKPS